MTQSFDKLVNLASITVIASLMVLGFGCNSHSGNSIRPAAESSLTLSQEDLTHVLKVGMETNDIVIALGIPGVARISESREAWRYAMSPFLKNKQTPNMYAVGVSMLITNGHLAEWDWVYMLTESLPSKAEELQTSKGSDTNASGLKFFVVANQPVSDGRYIDTPLFPKLGFIAVVPNLTLDKIADVRLEERSLPMPEDAKRSVWSFVISAREQDRDKLKKLTTENVTKKLLLMVDDQPIAAPMIIAPIENGAFGFTCSQRPQMEIIKKEMEKLKAQ